MLFLQPLLAVDDNTLTLVAQVAQHIALGMLALVAVAPSVGNAEGEGRRQHLEKTLAETAAEEHPPKIEPSVRVSQSVAVTHQHTLPAQLHHDRLVVHHSAHLLRQVVEYPHIVISDEKMNLHTLVGQLRQLP